MKFTKMQGAGNDYVYVNGFEEKISAEDKPEIVKRLSDRHFGIGSDGVIFINPATEADFEMEMYNADGSRSEMCGNGIRCVAKFVYDKGMTDKKEFTIVSAGKVKYMQLTTAINEKTGKEEAIRIRVNMGSPILTAKEIPVLSDSETAIATPIEVQGKTYEMTCVSMGNPHAVVFMKGAADLAIETVGPYFENHERFPRRTNTEFVEILDRGHVFMRVWERGTGETLACGTGCCATAVACILNGYTDKKVLVSVLGGEIEIEWDTDANLIYMTGPAVTVFEGEISL